MFTFIILSLLRKVPSINIFISEKLRSFTVSLVILIIFLAAPRSAAQTLHYEIWNDDKMIGTLTANCSHAGELTIYSVTTDVKTSFILTLNVSAKMEDVFKGGILYRSTYVQKINGFTRLDKKTTLLAGGYNLKNKSVEKKSKISLIHYSMACMYFVQPSNDSLVYSENFQQNVLVSYKGNDRYQVIFPDKRCSFYQYRNGLLIQLDVDTEWAKLTFKLIEEKYQAKR
jgi:hypothetical protein